MATMRRLALSGALSALPSASLLAQTAPDSGWVWHSGWGGMMFGSGLMMVVFWGGIVLLVVLLARWLGRTGPEPRQTQPRQTALELLEERYARGECDKQEFEERRKTLAG